MSEHDDDGGKVSRLWRGRAIAEKIMDEYGQVLDSHEGVFTALQLAYAEGVNDGSDLTLTALRAELAAL